MADYKKGKTIRSYRLCVLGPSFVGKTQIINRFLNNSFSPYYDQTTRVAYYRRVFNILEGEDVDPQFVELEIMDVFPHDHPLLDKDPDFNDLAREMSLKLNSIVKNSKEKENERIHGYMFVFDASNKNTFDTLSCLIETIKEIEKSERRGKRLIEYTPKKIVVGNKKDLKKKKGGLEKADLKKLEGMRYREASALTNQGVYEAFKILVSDIHSCIILSKEFYNKEKQKTKGNEDKDQEQDDGRPVNRGGFFSNMLPFACYGPRDDASEEDEEEEKNSGSEGEGEGEEQDKDQDKSKAKGKEEGGCLLF